MKAMHDKALAKTKDRFQTASELLSALHKALH